MNYTKESLSPCKIRVTVSVEAAEIDASLNGALALQQKNINLHGFRKGRVPFSVLEARFKSQIYREAAQDLVNVHVNQILGELDTPPVTPLVINPDPIEFVRGQALDYTIEFEHMPVFELPDYEGLEVTQKTAGEPTAQALDSLMQRLRAQDTKYVPVDGQLSPVDGQVANLDLDVLEGDKVLQSSKEADLVIGQKRPPELDELLKGLKPGESGETPCTFPEDFLNPEFQGKTLTLRVRLHAVKEAKAPTDEELLKKYKLKSMDELVARESELLKNQMNLLFRSQAQTELVDRLLKLVDFPIPPAMLESELDAVVQSAVYRAMQAGRSASDKELEEEKAARLPQITHNIKSFILLLAVGRKEGMEVSEEEVKARVLREAMQRGLDPQKLYQYYHEEGRLFAIRDSLITEKASQAIYAKAKVTMVPAEEPKEVKPEEKAEEVKPEERPEAPAAE